VSGVVRITVDLDDRVVEALLARYPGVPRAEAIERAVRVHLEASSVEGLLSLAGSFPIEDVSSEQATLPGHR
jgi:hypothetical protein